MNARVFKEKLFAVRMKSNGMTIFYSSRGDAKKA